MHFMAQNKSAKSTQVFDQDDDATDDGDDMEGETLETEIWHDPGLDKQMLARRRLEILREQRELQRNMEDWL